MAIAASGSWRLGVVSNRTVGFRRRLLTTASADGYCAPWNRFGAADMLSGFCPCFDSQPEELADHENRRPGNNL